MGTRRIANWMCHADACSGMCVRVYQDMPTLRELVAHGFTCVATLGRASGQCRDRTHLSPRQYKPVPVVAVDIAVVVEIAGLAGRTNLGPSIFLSSPIRTLSSFSAGPSVRFGVRFLLPTCAPS